jgi:ketosteroid isomerase-like protein
VTGESHCGAASFERAKREIVMLGKLVIAAALLVSTGALAGPKEDMMAADRAFAKMSLEKGAHAAFLAYMTDDVRLYDGDHPPIIGRRAVETYYAKNPDPKGSKLNWKPIEADASAAGDFGYTRGTWVFTAKDEKGRDVKVTGYYVTGWKRQADGTYKFNLDIGGADKPAH